MLRIDRQALPNIVDCPLNSGQLFTDLGGVYLIEFGVSLKHVYVDERRPFGQPGDTPFPTSVSILSFPESVFICRILWRPNGSELGWGLCSKLRERF